MIYQRSAEQVSGDTSLDLSPEMESIIEDKVRYYAALNDGRPDEAQLIYQAWKDATLALSQRTSAPAPRGSRLPAISRINEGGRLPQGGEVGQ